MPTYSGPRRSCLTKISRNEIHRQGKKIIYLPIAPSGGVRTLRDVVLSEAASDGLTVCQISSLYSFCFYLRDPKCIKILSLYTLPLAFFCKGPTYLHIHGFPILSHRPVKSIALWFFYLLASLSRKPAIMNSILTDSICTEVLGLFLQSTRLLCPYSQNLYSQITLCSTSNLQEITVSPLRIVFAGTLEPPKGILSITQGFCIFNLNQDSELFIIGKGSLTTSIPRHPDIHVYEWMEKPKVEEILSTCHVAISLNPLEPLGLFYIEALKMGLHVIAPIHTGFAENDIIRNHSRVHFINDINPASVAQKLEHIRSLFPD